MNTRQLVPWKPIDRLFDRQLPYDWGASKNNLRPATITYSEKIFRPPVWWARGPPRRDQELHHRPTKALGSKLWTDDLHPSPLARKRGRYRGNNSREIMMGGGRCRQRDPGQLGVLLGGPRGVGEGHLRQRAAAATHGDGGGAQAGGRGRRRGRNHR